MVLEPSRNWQPGVTWWYWRWYAHSTLLHECSWWDSAAGNYVDMVWCKMYGFHPITFNLDLLTLVSSSRDLWVCCWWGYSKTGAAGSLALVHLVDLTYTLRQTLEKNSWSIVDQVTLLLMPVCLGSGASSTPTDDKGGGGNSVDSKNLSPNGGGSKSPSMIPIVMPVPQAQPVARQFRFQFLNHKSPSINHMYQPIS